MSWPTISGLKLAPGLVLVTLEGLDQERFARLLSDLAAECINLPFLSLQLLARPRGRACLCMEADHARRVPELAPDLNPGLRPVAALTLYPRGGGVELLAAVQAVLAGQGLAPLAVGTSHAAVVVLLDQDQAPAALELLPRALKLPPHRSPPTEVIKVVPEGEAACGGMAVVAAYHEHPVRTYGLQTCGGLSLLAAACPGGELAPACRSLCNCAGQLPLRFCTTQLDPHRCRWELCLPEAAVQPMCEYLAQCGLELLAPPHDAGLIHLQGPHFGDRYGIASLALQALNRAGVRLMALGAVVHSLFMVLAAGDCASGLRALQANFCGPE